MLKLMNLSSVNENTTKDTKLNVFGMVERKTERRIHLVAVENRKAKRSTNELITNIANDSFVLSDCWKGYKDIIGNFADHLQFNHSKYFKDPV